VADLVALAASAATESRSKADLTGDLEGSVVHPARTVELGSWLGILTEDLELSDYGMALRWLAGQEGEPANHAIHAKGVKELLLWLLLRQDTLLLALLRQGSRQARSGMPRIEEAIGRLLADCRAVASPDQFVPAMNLSEFLHQLESVPGRLESAQVARIEILAALDFVHMGEGGSASDEPEAPLKSLMSELQGRSLTIDGARAFLDQRYFTGVAAESSRARLGSHNADQALLWLVQAFLAIQRPLGFTPGRPVSLLACCLALRAGAVMEIREAYDCIYEAAESRWSEHLHFSGGSRFDREFLIRIDPVLEEHLESELETPPKSS
jgi:hypothetical protein